MAKLNSAHLLAKLDQIETLITPRTVRVRKYLHVLRGGECLGGTLKIVAAYGCLKHQFETKDIDWNKVRIIDGSSGGFGTALALLCKFLGLRCTIVANTGASEQTRNIIKKFGAELVAGNGNTTKQSYAQAKEIAQADSTYILSSQLECWGNPHAHSKITGPAVTAVVGNLSRIICTGGSYGTAWGILKHLTEKFSIGTNVRLFVVQAAEGSKIVGTASVVEGVDYVTPFRVSAEEKWGNLFEKVIVTQTDAGNGIGELFRETALFSGYSSGAVYAAHKIIQNKYGVGRGSTILISVDDGYRYLDKFPW